MRSLRPSAFLLVLLVAALAPRGYAQMPARADRVSNASFDKTVSQLEAAIQSKGMMIVAMTDHQNMLRMVGTRIGGSKTIEFGKPEMGKMLLAGHPESGLEMPARLYVWERSDGKTMVSYYKSNLAGYSAEEVRRAGAMMDEALAAIVLEGTK